LQNNFFLCYLCDCILNKTDENMRTSIEERWGTHPDDVKRYDTAQLRKEFLVDKLLEQDAVNMVYTHNDRLVIGAALPVAEALKLEAPALLRSEYFCERREAGVVCIENEGIISVDGVEYALAYKDALYIGRGAKEVIFKSIDAAKPVKFYFASAPAHTAYPTALITKERRRVRELGVKATSNERTLNQLILNEIVPCCQLQMGLTEIKEGSVWNTMHAASHPFAPHGSIFLLQSA